MKEANDERHQLTEDNELLYEQVQLLQRQSNDLNWQVSMPHIVQNSWQPT